MKCPNCGFNNLARGDRCVRCKKPMAAAGAPTSKSRPGKVLNLDASGSFDLAQALEHTEGEFSAALAASTGAPPSDSSALGDITEVAEEVSGSAWETEAEREDAKILQALEREIMSEASEAGVFWEDGSQSEASFLDARDDDDDTENVPDPASAPFEALDEASAGSGSESAGIAAALMQEVDDALAAIPADEITEDLTDERSAGAVEARAEMSEPGTDADLDSALLAVLESADPMETEIIDQLGLAIAPEPTPEPTPKPAPSRPAAPAPLVLTATPRQQDLFADLAAAPAPPASPAPAEVAAAVLETMAGSEGDPSYYSELEDESSRSLAESSAPSVSDSVVARRRMIDDFFGRDDDGPSRRPAPPCRDEDSLIAIERPSLDSDTRPPSYELPFSDELSASWGSPGLKVKGVRRAPGILDRIRFPGFRMPRLRRPRLQWTPDTRRVAAGLLDLAVWWWLGLMLYEAGRLTVGAGAFGGTAGQWVALVAAPLGLMAVVLALVYGSLFGVLTGQTPGMMVFKLRIQGLDGSRPGLAGALVWTALQIVGLAPLGLGMLALRRGDSDQWVHDRWAGVRVETIPT